MPAAPRVKNKATKIAFQILGIPPNIKFKRNKQEKEINRRLVYEETFRSR